MTLFLCADISTLDCLYQLGMPHSSVGMYYKVDNKSLIDALYSSKGVEVGRLMIYVTVLWDTLLRNNCPFPY